MSPRRRIVAAIAGAAVLTACSTTVSGTGGALQAPGRSTSLAQFGNCGFDLSSVPFPAGRRADLTFTCASIDVPLDYDTATSSTISLELVKVHDRHNSGSADLVVNPGGPGGSGVEAAIGLATQVSDSLLAHFDLVGFDPRGVGLSTPLRCVSNAQKDKLNAASYDIRTASGFAAAKALAKQFSDACLQKYGPAIANYNTVETAKDMDRIRQALGQAQLTYLGFSYGTELGGVYAHLFPKNLRVAVLDGAVDPLLDDVTEFGDQIAGFEAAFDQFATDCPTKSACAPLGDPRQAVYSIVAAATAQPIPSGSGTDTRSATSALVLTAVAEALYSSSDWPTLARALIAAKAGRSEGLLQLADDYYQRASDGSYSNLLDANNVISCNDAPLGPSDATIHATTAQWVQKYPMFGLSFAQALFSCQQWQTHRMPVPRPTAATAHKVLVVGNLHDPATPYQGARDLAKTMGNAELLTWDGEGHTSYLGGSTCIDNYINAYLINGTLPPDHTTCAR